VLKNNESFNKDWFWEGEKEKYNLTLCIVLVVLRNNTIQFLKRLVREVKVILPLPCLLFHIYLI
jgi:hypothetical protein